MGLWVPIAASTVLGTSSTIYGCMEVLLLLVRGNFQMMHTVCKRKRLGTMCACLCGKFTHHCESKVLPSVSRSRV